MGMHIRAQKPVPEDGLYHVSVAYTDPTSQETPSGTVLVRYNYRFVDSTAQSIKLIAIDTAEFVPLMLQTTPDTIRQADARYRLILTLTKPAKRKLRKLSKQWVDTHVALVVGGEAVTLHKVREQITGGRIQVTRCTDDACEYLFYTLRDNVVE